MATRWRIRFAHIIGAATAVATLAIPGLAVGAPAASAAPAPTLAIADTTVDAPCGRADIPVKIRWYLPDAPPTGLLWLQHGFARSAQNLDGLARSYAAQGFLIASTSIDSFSVAGCSVSYNLADNKVFVAAMATVFGDADEPAGALAHSLNRANAMAHRSIAMPPRMIFSGHSAGGEFVVTAADALRRSDLIGYRRLQGLVLLDPVNSFQGNNFRTAVTELSTADLLIRVISTPPSLSNNFGSAVRILEHSTRQPFLGVQLTTGVHIDAEGESTDIIGIASQLAAPRPRNVRVIRTLAPHWADDLVTGHRTPAFYPGGSYYQRLVQSNTITTLPTK